jgi:hypothetical protein
VNRKSDIEKREKLRKLREQRLYGKKVQQEVLQKRQEDKTKLLKTMKKVRKGTKPVEKTNKFVFYLFNIGKQGGMQELEESLGDRKRNFGRPNGNDNNRK